MRKFSSYGPVDKDLHFYVPREELIQNVCRQLIGDEPPNKGGHYITVWAPRQCGKTWVMREVLWRLQEDERFDVIKLNIEDLKTEQNLNQLLSFFSTELFKALKLKETPVTHLKEFGALFTRNVLKKPLILILDEFDSLTEDMISGVVSIFRNIYINRMDDKRPSPQKEYLLHGVALIGVRSVLGVENVKGSPFNVQRSMRIPNLTFDEVHSMFKWYEQESGQTIEQDVINRVFYETQGQPGLVSWLGELLTETYNAAPERSITMKQFDYMFVRAIRALPNNNIINLISKAKQAPYKNVVLEVYKTERKLEFTFDDPLLSFLYMNGVMDIEETDDNLYVKFSNPLVQKRLFNYFARDLFGYMGQISDISEGVADIFEDDGLNIKNLIRRFEQHLQKNREWLLKDAPRRKDLRIFEAVYHFSLYEYLNKFLATRKANVWPEFPTGNGKVDLLIRYQHHLYAIELKSFTHEDDFREALLQAARYAKSLNLPIIHLVVFVDDIPDDLREKYETDYWDQDTDVRVFPVFAATGR